TPDGEPAELGAAAADVEHQGPARRPVQQRRAAVEGELRLLAAGDDLDLDPGLALHPLDEGIAIDRLAAGLGGDAAGMGDAAPPHLVGAYPERRHGALH